MSARYLIKSSKNSKLIERIYFKKLNNIFYVENTSSNFNFICSSQPKRISDDLHSVEDLINFDEIVKFKVNIVQITDVDNIDFKEIRKIIKKENYSKLEILGWTYFDYSRNIHGQFECSEIPFSCIEIFGDELSIEYSSLDKDDVNKINDFQISENDFDSLNFNYESGLENLSFEIKVNGKLLDLKMSKDTIIKKNRFRENISKPCLIKSIFSKGAHYSLTVYEEFNESKLTISSHEICIGKSKINVHVIYRITYDGHDLELIDSIPKYENIELISSDGKSHCIDVVTDDDD